MKETLDDNSRQDLIEYRMSRAIETIDEAAYIANGGYYNASINRLYYACFYAASALMLKVGLDTSTHKGVRNQLSLHFISKGKLDPKFGSIYARLFQARHSSDYEDFAYCDVNMYNEYMPQARQFITAIKELIETL